MQPSVLRAHKQLRAALEQMGHWSPACLPGTLLRLQPSSLFACQVLPPYFSSRENERDSVPQPWHALAHALQH